ncbi:hypothetical protein CLV46_1389 [Diaminobutyricimonas aerilata]|uniref:Uncharacterized protein n=1 Tax=Diaminobutyricimonas aerilata TaxID=1162967 RepID=A0A2M9CIT5_9MICO|nr:hypothetical protein [Diaminobutyricimonas aerilata]PJJ71836.1 hypothetical protein CLV46_1389 [Diaminobutyricimonas aerilata]
MSDQQHFDDGIDKDTDYSPGSERETQVRQDEPASAAVADEADDPGVQVRPGTGGPDDVGDVRVDEDDLNMPDDSGRSHDA